MRNYFHFTWCIFPCAVRPSVVMVQIRQGQLEPLPWRQGYTRGCYALYLKCACVCVSECVLSISLYHLLQVSLSLFPIMLMSLLNFRLESDSVIFSEHVPNSRLSVYASCNSPPKKRMQVILQEKKKKFPLLFFGVLSSCHSPCPIPS